MTVLGYIRTISTQLNEKESHEKADFGVKP